MARLRTRLTRVKMNAQNFERILKARPLTSEAIT